MTLSPQNVVGSGFFDITSKIGSKLTGKTAFKLASKAAEILLKKEQKKLVKFLVKKFMISFLQSEKINQFKHMKQKEKKLSNF